MERIEFVACDEKLGDFGQFIVVEETFITQGERWARKYYCKI